MQGDPNGFVDRTLGFSQSDRRRLQEIVSNLQGVRVELVALADVGHEPELLRVLGIDLLASQDELLGARYSDLPGQQLGPSTGRDQPDPRLGKTDLRPLGGNDEVTGQCELAAATERETEDR